MTEAIESILHPCGSLRVLSGGLTLAFKAKPFMSTDLTLVLDGALQVSVDPVLTAGGELFPTLISVSYR